MSMHMQEFGEIVSKPYSDGAFLRSDFPGFREDYLVIHSLIRRYKPKSFLEIGTSSGSGTNVICRAIGVNRFVGRKNVVYSIDVPPHTDPNILYPQHEDGHPDKAGRYCVFPYTQLFGDSSKFDFSKYYPLEGWFIDGKHNYEFAVADTKQALLSDPKLIIWHDVQIDEVKKGINDVMEPLKEWNVYFVNPTRVAYAVKNIQ